MLLSQRPLLAVYLYCFDIYCSCCCCAAAAIAMRCLWRASSGCAAATLSVASVVSSGVGGVPTMALSSAMRCFTYDSNKNSKSLSESCSCPTLNPKF